MHEDQDEDEELQKINRFWSGKMPIDDFVGFQEDYVRLLVSKYC